MDMDAAATILKDGVVTACVEEERISELKIHLVYPYSLYKICFEIVE